MRNGARSAQKLAGKRVRFPDCEGGESISKVRIPTSLASALSKNPTSPKIWEKWHPGFTVVPRWEIFQKNFEWSGAHHREFMSAAASLRSV